VEVGIWGITQEVGGVEWFPHEIPRPRVGSRVSVATVMAGLPGAEVEIGCLTMTGIVDGVVAN